MKLNKPSLGRECRGAEGQACAGKAARKAGLLPPPVGTSDWATFSRDSYCVDKTLILKDLIDSKSRVVLFTRPRRFGKTTMLEMVRAFYEGEASLFRDKKIWAAGYLKVASSIEEGMCKVALPNHEIALFFQKFNH